MLGEMPSEAVSTSRAISLDRSASDLVRGSKMTTISRGLQRNSSDSLNQNRTPGPFSSDMKKACGKSRVPYFEERSTVNTVGGRQCSGQSFAINKSNRKSERNGRETEQAPSCLLEGRVSSHVEGLGIVSSCCFGRVATTTRKLPREENVKGHGSAETSSRALLCKKSKHTLRKLSCMSSADVLPSVTSTAVASSHSLGSRPKPRARNSNHKSQLVSESRHGRSLLARSTGCMLRRNSHGSKGLLSKEGGPANVDPLPTQSVRSSMSALRTGKWCSIRPTVIKPDTMVSSGNMSQISSVLQVRNGGYNPTRLSLDSRVTTPEGSFIEDEGISQGLVATHNRDPVFCARDIGETDADRRDTTRGWVDSGLSTSTPDCASADSSILSRSSSASRSARIPSLYSMWHLTGSLEAMSSPSSYMSSPDVHLSNSDGLYSYASTFQSPDLNRTVSSPDYHQDGYHGQSTRTPVYRPFRRFPLRSFEENQECFTFEGVSEILSAREHVERDEISYEQVFMLEANFLLGGMSSHDHHRDLRLDIDNMSYEDLLALEESIGYVCTGLEKDAVSRCLKSEKYFFSNNAAPHPISQDVEVKCSICQEDFEEGIELGILQCGHNHHFSCIEQWLQRKNECPICKATAS